MPGGIYLSPTELKSLTGYMIRPAVVRWLERNDWPFASPGADGWPRVLRRYHDDRLSGVRISRQAKSKIEPAWSA